MFWAQAYHSLEGFQRTGIVQRFEVKILTCVFWQLILFRRRWKAIISKNMWKTSPAPAKSLPCLYRLQEGLRQSLAWRFVGNHLEIHYRHLIQFIKHLYDKATSAVLFNGSIGDWFQSTAEVRQGCLLSPSLFKPANVFPQNSSLRSVQSADMFRSASWLQGHHVLAELSGHVWGDSKGVINFPWIFRQCGV